MKKRLRLLAWMLTLTMLCELLPFGAFAQSDVGQQLALAAAQSLEEENGEAVASGSCGSYVKWSLSGDGTLTIYGRGAIYNYHPNENLCNLPPWWDYRESINTIILDSEISRIGDAAFYGCNIASIDIPDNIHSIGKWAFSYCTRLSSVTIPDGMTSIAWSAFSNTALTSFTIPESVTSIDGYAFSNCPLSSITIPDNVTSIGEYAFSGCSLLTHISIPKSVTAVNDNTFAGCTSLTSISIPHSVTSIGSSAFRSCSSLSSVNIPNSVVSIGSFAFNHCSALTSVNIPDSVTSIESFAFANCSALTSVNIPKHVTSIGYDAFSDCFSLTSISIPDSVTSIDRDAFDLCPSLSDVYYSGSKNQWDAISISSGNDDLLNATIHFQNSNTGNDSIYSGKCGDNLTWTLSSDGVLTIDGTGEMYDFSLSSNAWSDYSDNIKTVIVNYGVTHIGDYAFNACTNLCSVTLPESVISIGHNAFYRCDSLTSIILPESVSSIGKAAFRGCKALTAVNIPTSITSIENYTFDNCESLATINIPKSVISIGLYAFGSCASLNSIDIPESVTSIGYGAFSRCTSLTSVTIPKSIASIETYTFNNCTSLASIYIHESVTSINKEAFFECTSLSDVYYSGNQEQWDSISIDSGNDPLLNATIHYQSAEPEDEKEFTFGRDNLSFLNAADYYFQGDELEYWNRKYNKNFNFVDYIISHPSQYASMHLSSEKFKQLTKNLSPSASDYFKSKVYTGGIWGGSCFGMVTVAAIRYMSPNRLPVSRISSTSLSNYSPNYDLPYPVDNSEIEDLINYYWASQFLPTEYKLWLTYAYNFAHDCDSVLDEIIASLSKKVPVVAALPDHSILLLDIKEVHSDHYVLGAYDPNDTTEQTLILYTEPDIDEDGDGQLKIKYHGKTSFIKYYILSSDLNFLDIRNYFRTNIDNETSTEYNDAHITLTADGKHNIARGNQYFYRDENGKLIEKDSSVRVLYPTGYLDDGSSPSTVELVFPKPSSSEDFRVELSSDEVNNASLLLNGTLISISTNGPVELTYNEADRTVDVTAEAPTDVNLLMTKNDVDESWPWHSWALDTTGTTTLHADLDDDGLHLSGDGITNAKYATENADTENVDSGTISVQPDADGITTVTITNKKSSSGDSLEIVTPSAPTTGNAITITSGFAYIDDPEQPVNSAALGDVVTIVANDRSSEGKTFTGWVVNSGDVTLDDSSASPTSFTMGDKAVSITAQYSTNSTPTPNPGGGSSSGGGGGGGGGGAAVLIGVGAAAAITAGVIMMSPVEIKGRVVLADHTALPGAKISLLREGKVVAQTTADENGSFSLKAKRGSYELTAAYTTADGQLIYKTIDIKAPSKDLTVTF